MGNNKIPLLEFNNLSVSKGSNQKILDAISLRIFEGENVALLGPNGAGKSSLLKVITREYYPLKENNGCSFLIWGQKSWNIFELRKLLGIVSNDLQHVYTRNTTGLDVVLSGFFSSIGLFHERITSSMKKKARKVIEFLEVDHLKGRPMNEMSTGEARRFLIARALVHDPKALILDEPTSSLDPHAAYKCSDMVRKIVRSGKSLILVTQNLYDIIPEIKRVVLMNEGRITRDGDKKSILTSRTISKLFGYPIEIKHKDGFYYGLRGKKRLK